MPHANANPMLRVVRIALPFWRSMALATVFGALTIIASVSLMANSAWLISKAALQPSIADLSVAVVGVRFFGIARGVLRYLERLVSHDTTFRLLARLRVAFYQSLEPLAPARLASLRSGDLLSRAIDDIESLQNLYLRAIAPPMIAVLAALFTTVLLGLFDPLLALVALGFMLVAGVGVPLLAWRGNQTVGAQRVQTRAERNASLVDQIQGMAETLVYSRAAAQMARSAQLERVASAQEMRMAHVDGLQIALLVFLTQGAGLALLVLAIPRLDGVLLATVVLATIAVFEAFGPLAQAAVNLGVSNQASRRLFDIIDTPPAVREAALPAPAPSAYDLHVRGLRFRYDADQPLVLDSLDLSLPAGKRVAILGESGAGKSTLVNVLLRFWDYEGGTIELGGRELRDYALSDVRSTFAVMSQRTHLFNTTIGENIRLARMDATQEEVEAAARQAQIHDFITSLPQGYGTLVGEDGAALSGGQRQRVALARALLKGSPILILDEATANLDTATERAVMQTILDSTAGRSLLVITHRRTLLEQMDAVYVLHEGRLQPTG
ncbi:MAG: thiol reductant ABC exporter subunit CydC [Anaerolineae bacterium]|nr:thiol reductant ABC exporter subunit CydC [Anaerolineae bacterium]MDW8173853.1 thiol reductant ABC exporter subunit CydC [Anaerolineae bacterium]